MAKGKAKDIEKNNGMAQWKARQGTAEGMADGKHQENMKLLKSYLILLNPLN